MSSIITREQIDTLRGLLNDVQASDEVGNRALTAMGDLLDRVEARRPATVIPNLLAEVERLRAENADMAERLRNSKTYDALREHALKHGGRR